MKNIKWLLNFTKEELYSIQLCHQCYTNATLHPADWFTMVCDRPHLLIWARQKSYPYWPAKLMSMNNGSVDVHFFGAHSRAVLTPKDCMMFSQKNPSTNIRPYKDDLEKAQQVSNDLLTNYFLPAVYIFNTDSKYIFFKITTNYSLFTTSMWCIL